MNEIIAWKTRNSNSYRLKGEMIARMSKEELSLEVFTSLSDFLSEEYIKESDGDYRKKRGQFFTPKEVGLYMAHQFDIKGKEIRLLDPGAGVGSLTAAFCSRIAQYKDRISLTVDAYDCDKKVVPLLKRMLFCCKEVLHQKGHSFNYNVIQKNFILDNPNFLNSRTLFGNNGNNKEGVLYDYVLSNPPYYKLNKNSPEASLLKEFVCGQPNIYSFFMALSLEMLKNLRTGSGVKARSVPELGHFSERRENRSKGFTIIL